MRVAGRRVLVVAVALGTVASLLVTLPNFAAWTPPTPQEASVITPGSVLTGDRFAELFGATAPAGDERAGDAPRPDDGEVFDGPGFVPVDKPIAATTKPVVPIAPEDRKPVRELVERRTATTEWWLNNDGTVTKRSFDRPKYFDAGGGKFEAINTKVIVDATRPGSFTNVAGAQRFTFSPIRANGDGGVEITTPGRDPIRFWPSFAKPTGKDGVVPVVGVGPRANTVTYTDVAPGVDLVYSVEVTGLVERIVLRAPTKIADWSFEVEGAALQAKKDGTGKDAANVLESADPADRFVLPGAMVIEANGEPRKDANKAAAQVKEAAAQK